MKTISITLLLVFTIIFSAEAQSIHHLDLKQTTLNWEGYYTYFFGGHDGTVDIIEGSVTMQNDKINGGYFLVDMRSLKNTDGGYNEGLTNHLKDPDFFDTETYPEASLNILNVVYESSTDIRVYGDLTIKGITNPIDFRGTINYDAKTITTQFKIDRKLWGITYNSSLQDNSISDAIGFKALLTFE